MNWSYKSKRKLAKARYSSFGKRVQKFYASPIGKGVIHGLYFVPFCGIGLNRFIPKKKRTATMKFLTFSSPIALGAKIILGPYIIYGASTGNWNIIKYIKDSVIEKNINKLEQIIENKEDAIDFIGPPKNYEWKIDSTILDKNYLRKFH